MKTKTAVGWYKHETMLWRGEFRWPEGHTLSDVLIDIAEMYREKTWRKFGNVTPIDNRVMIVYDDEMASLRVYWRESGE